MKFELSFFNDVALDLLIISSSYLLIFISNEFSDFKILLVDFTSLFFLIPPKVQPKYLFLKLNFYFYNF